MEFRGHMDAPHLLAAGRYACLPGRCLSGRWSGIRSRPGWWTLRKPGRGPARPPTWRRAAIPWPRGLGWPRERPHGAAHGKSISGTRTSKAWASRCAATRTHDGRWETAASWSEWAPCSVETSCRRSPGQKADRRDEYGVTGNLIALPTFAADFRDPGCLPTIDDIGDEGHSAKIHHAYVQNVLLS